MLTVASSVASSTATETKYQLGVLCQEEELEILQKRETIRQRVRETAYNALLSVSSPTSGQDKAPSSTADDATCSLNNALDWMLRGPTADQEMDVMKAMELLSNDLHSNLAAIGACIRRERRRINTVALRNQKRSRKPSVHARRQIEESAQILEAAFASYPLSSLVGAFEEGDDEPSRMEAEMLRRTVADAAAASVLSKLSDRPHASAKSDLQRTCFTASEMAALVSETRSNAIARWKSRQAEAPQQRRAAADMPLFVRVFHDIQQWTEKGHGASYLEKLSAMNATIAPPANNKSSSLFDLSFVQGFSAYSAYTLGRHLLQEYVAIAANALGDGVSLSSGPIPVGIILPTFPTYAFTSFSSHSSANSTLGDDDVSAAAASQLSALLTVERLHKLLTSAVVLLSISCELLAREGSGAGVTVSPLHKPAHADPLEAATMPHIVDSLIGTVEGGGVADAMQAPSFLTRYPKQFFAGDSHCFLGLAVRELDRLRIEVIQRLPLKVMDRVASWLHAETAALFGSPDDVDGDVIPTSVRALFPTSMLALQRTPSETVEGLSQFAAWVLTQVPSGCRHILDTEETSAGIGARRIEVRHCMMKCLELNDGNHTIAWQVLAEELPNGEEVTIGGAGGPKGRPVGSLAGFIIKESSEANGKRNGAASDAASTAMATAASSATVKSRMLASVATEVGGLINSTNGYFAAGYATSLMATRLLSAGFALYQEADDDRDALPPLLHATSSPHPPNSGQSPQAGGTPRHTFSGSSPLEGTYLGEHTKTSCYCEAIRCNGGYNHATSPHLLETLWLPLAQSLVFSHNPDIGAEEVLIAVGRGAWYDDSDTELVTLDKLQILLHVLSLERVAVPEAYYELGQIVELGFSTTTVHADPDTGLIAMGSVPSSLDLARVLQGARPLLTESEVEMVLFAADEFMPYDADQCGQRLRLQLEALRRVFYPVGDPCEAIEAIDEEDPDDPASRFAMVLPKSDERAILWRTVACKNVRVVRESKVEVTFESFAPLPEKKPPSKPASLGDEFDDRLRDLAPSPSTTPQSLSLSRVSCFALGLSLVPTCHSGLWMRLGMSLEDVGQCRFKEAVETLRAGIVLSRRVLASNQQIRHLRTVQRLEAAMGEDGSSGIPEAIRLKPISTTPHIYTTLPEEYVPALKTANRLNLIYNDISQPVPEAELLFNSAEATRAFDEICKGVAQAVAREGDEAAAGHPLGQLLEHSPDVYQRHIMSFEDGGDGTGEAGGVFTRLDALVMAVRASRGLDPKAWFVLGTCLGERTLTRQRTGLRRGGSFDFAKVQAMYPFCTPDEASLLGRALQEKSDLFLTESVHIPAELLLQPSQAVSDANDGDRPRNDTTTEVVSSSFRDILVEEFGRFGKLVEVDALCCFAQAERLSPVSMSRIVGAWRKKLGC